MARIALNRSRGFTLVELMVVVAIIGVLASVAIPSFLNYQLTSKRAEAYANLASLAKSQKAYYAEYNRFVDVASEPYGALGVLPTSTKRDKTSIDSAFAVVGWVPDGNVFFDYDTVTPDSTGASCDCDEACFTAAAYGDLDGNGRMSVLLYAQPDAVGDFCDSMLLSQSPPETSPGSGIRQLNTVARVTLADDF